MKVLHPAQARKKVAVKRFHQEARSAGAIGHPNICEVVRPSARSTTEAPISSWERCLSRRDARRLGSPARGGPPSTTSSTCSRKVLSGLVRCAREGDRPSRHQAREHLPHQARRVSAAGKAARFRRLQDDCPLCPTRKRGGPRSHAHRHGHGDAVLHEPRAGARRPEPRRPRGPLRLRDHPLRGADREAPVHGGELQRAPPPDPDDQLPARRASFAPPCPPASTRCSTKRSRGAARTASRPRPSSNGSSRRSATATRRRQVGWT